MGLVNQNQEQIERFSRQGLFLTKTEREKKWKTKRYTSNILWFQSSAFKYKNFNFIKLLRCHLNIFLKTARFVGHKLPCGLQKVLYFWVSEYLVFQTAAVTMKRRIPISGAVPAKKRRVSSSNDSSSPGVQLNCNKQQCAICLCTVQDAVILCNNFF